MVAVAIGAAAVVGAGATVFAGSKAASAQTQAANASIGEQQSEYNQTRADYAPWRTAGATALGALTNAYGLTGTSGSPGAVGTEQGQPLSGAYGGFFTSPGYQFRRDQGLQAIDRGAAASGRLGSGATIKAEQRYGDGLAASEYDSYTSRLAQLAGLGQSATAGTAAAGSSAANNISSALINSGNARASSYTNTASAVNSGLNNVMTAYLMRNQLSNASSYGAASGNTYSGDGVGFSDRRLKTNIELIRRDPDGLGWYNWKWKTDPNGPVVHGVIADEVKEVRPQAYVPDYRGSGFDGVNYAILGSR